jgi:hypothetical protein
MLPPERFGYVQEDTHFSKEYFLDEWYILAANAWYNLGEIARYIPGEIYWYILG